MFVLHQPPGRATLPVDAPVWRTCLREVAFVDDWHRAAPGQQLVGHAEAYALLLEIVTGLRSPLVGETEVQAQFKAFLASLDPAAHLDLHRLGQRVLADAKYIRQHHLQGFGAHSYGVLAARRVPSGRRVALVGAGALAGQVTAALAGRHTIDQWARRAVEGRPALLLIATADARGVVSSAPTTLVLASPVASAVAATVARCYADVREVIDLRSADQRSPIADDLPVVTLDTLFADARGSACMPAERIEAARSDITRLARAFERREQVRPLGWDDLCA
ncbi:MAG: hypothetical protein IT184_05205 [Acidobacteria bacterium]|nr:hypothetical protein [Acidobacteriota bacterium]